MTGSNWLPTSLLHAWHVSILFALTSDPCRSVQNPCFDPTQVFSYGAYFWTTFHFEKKKRRLATEEFDFTCVCNIWIWWLCSAVIIKPSGKIFTHEKDWERIKSRMAGDETWGAKGIIAYEIRGHGGSLYIFRFRHVVTCPACQKANRRSSVSRPGHSWEALPWEVLSPCRRLELLRGTLTQGFVLATRNLSAKRERGAPDFKFIYLWPN